MQYHIAAITLTFIAFYTGGIASGETLQPLTPQRYASVMTRALSLAETRDYEEATRILESAILQAGEQGKEEWKATMLSFLGSLYQRMARYVDAEEALNKAIREITDLKGAESLDLIGPLANIGGLYYEARQYASAEKYVVKALELQMRADAIDTKLTGMLLTNLGSVYFSEHKDKEAQKAAETALEKFAIAKGQDTSQGTARNYALLGAIHLASREFSEAELYLTKARDLWETAGRPDDPRRAESVANLGIYYSATGSYEKAESLFKQAEAVFQTYGGNNAYLQHYLQEYYAVEQKLGHKKEAKKILKELQQVANVGAANVLSRNIVDVSTFRAEK